MKDFGMVNDAEQSFDYLHDATTDIQGSCTTPNKGQSGSLSFLLDSSPNNLDDRNNEGKNRKDQQTPQQEMINEGGDKESDGRGRPLRFRGSNENKQNIVTRKLIMSPPTSTPVVPQTPAGMGTTNTEPKSFVNGLLSPFSPLLHSTNLANIDDEDDAEANLLLNEEEKSQLMKDQRNEYLQFVSLQPCRKVSIVVRVTDVNDDNDDGSSAKRCIFPHFRDEIATADDELQNTSAQRKVFSTPPRKSAAVVPSTPPSQPIPSSSSLIASPNSNNVHPRDVVVVNPTAFGRNIPSLVTMETAKLVAQVANISSEDWARLYEFHHVMWPQSQSTKKKKNEAMGQSNITTNENKKNIDAYSTLDSLSRAVVQDLLVEHQSSLLISLGQEGSCIGTSDHPSSTLGLWPKIMNLCSAMLETKGIVRLTMVEILEHSSTQGRGDVGSGGGRQGGGDSFRDLLAPSNQKPSTISLRHYDMKGAVLEGLTEVSIDSMPALLEALSRSRQRHAQRRRSRSGRTNPPVIAVVGMLHYWDHAVSYEVNKPSISTVTCVELSSNAANISKNSSNSKSYKEKNTIESVTHRKSIVSLGQALRQLLLQQSTTSHPLSSKNNGVESSELPPVVSYRETTLTKVLQRSMESSNIVLIASISPLSVDYDQTVATLNYLRRLLVKPGNIVTSPFQTKHGNKHTITATPQTAKINNRSNSSYSLEMSTNSAGANDKAFQALANDGRMLENLISDPRQRLAKLFHGTPEKKGPSTPSSMPRSGSKKPWENVLDRMHDDQPSTAFQYREQYEQRRQVGQDDRNAVKEGKESFAAVSLSDLSAVIPDVDSDTVDSNSIISRGKPNSYAGPPEESRQGMESPNSAQRQLSWRQDDNNDDEDSDGVHKYEINCNNDYDSHSDDDKWVSEGDSECELLNGSHFKDKLLENGIDGVMTQLCPEENFEVEKVLKDAQSDYDFTRYQEEEENQCEIHETQNNDAVNVSHGYRDKEAQRHVDKEEPSRRQGSFNDSIVVSQYEETHYDNAIEQNTVTDTVDPAEVINDHFEEDFSMQNNNYSESHVEMQYDEPPENGDNNRKDEEGIYSKTHEIEGEEDEGKDNLALESLTEQIYTEQDNDTLENSGHQSHFIDKQSQEGNKNDPTREDFVTDILDDDTNASPGLKSINNDPRSQEYTKHVTLPTISKAFATGSPTANESNEYIDTETTYDLPEMSLPVNIPLKSSNVTSQLPSPTDDSSNYDDFSSHFPKTRVTTALSSREPSKNLTHLQSSEVIEKLKKELKAVSEDRDSRIKLYEEEIQQLHDAINERTSQQQDMQKLFRERDSKLENAAEAQRTLEQIADDAVTAHKSEVEKSRALLSEKDDLQTTIETLQSKIQFLELDHDDHVKKYQQEIKQVYTTLENESGEKRSIQKVADDTRFELETQTGKVRALSLEIDELQSSLSSAKASATKASGENTDYLRRYKHEIQQLHNKLDEEFNKNLAIEKQLSACRSSNIRLEGIRRDEQITIRKMSADLRKKDSERVDVEKFQSELQRLKHQKEHLESLVEHSKVEYSGLLKDLEEECKNVKNKNMTLEEEVTSMQLELSSSQKEKGEITENFRSSKQSILRLSQELHGKEETLERLQSSHKHIESLRKEDQETIRDLNGRLRERESESIDIDQLHHRISRLKNDKDHLQNLFESSKVEYERAMDERGNVAFEYKNQVEALKRKLDDAIQSNHRLENDAQDQLRSLRESESNLMHNMRQRDSKIDRLEDEISKQKEQILLLHRRELSYSDNYASEINHLKTQLDNLEINLVSTMQEKDEALNRLKYDSRSHETLRNELERSKEDVDRFKVAIGILNEELDERQQEALHTKDIMLKMESTPRKFKAETKARVGTLMNRDESGSYMMLERTRDESRHLTNNIQNLYGMVEKLRGERDICFQSLKDGQKKLSKISSPKNVVAEFNDDLLETPSSRQRYRDSPTMSRSSTRPPIESVITQTPRPPRTHPEIYVTNFNLGSDVDLSKRAEEIAACIDAISPRNNLEDNEEEVSHLRSQIHRLEDERSAELSALKAKVKNLQEELSYEKIDSGSTSIYGNSEAHKETTLRS